jgi:proline dehydrogenase
MLRHFFRTTLIALSQASWAKRWITRSPVAWRAASRFVAGETLADALRVIQALNQRGIYGTLDYLGESVFQAADAQSAAGEILRALEAIHQSGASANLSIKLSQIGLALDETLCRQLLQRILQQAAAWNIFIRIDMEGSSLTEPTLRMWQWARQQGFQLVGIVIQAYLYRSEADIRQIVAQGGRVRLCKGAYDEPAAVAFPQKADVDQNYDHLAGLLLQSTARGAAVGPAAGGCIPPVLALATHDEARVRFAQTELVRLGLHQQEIEFQMLYGVRRELQERLVAEGYPVRVYVPYGTQWYPYFMRRLAERPANVWFFVSNYFRR